MPKTLRIPLTSAAIYQPSLSQTLQSALSPFASSVHDPFAIMTTIVIGEAGNYSKSSNDVFVLTCGDGGGIETHNLFKASDALKARCGHAAFASIGDNACLNVLRGALPVPSRRFIDTFYVAIFLRHGILLALAEDLATNLYDAALELDPDASDPELTEDIAGDAFIVFAPETISNHERLVLASEATEIIRLLFIDGVSQTRHKESLRFCEGVEFEVQA
jgi:hypothetical protein